jgi:predicted nucleic acid-binding Zn ribbon protein
MSEDKIVITSAIRLAVLREECEIGGHNFDVVMEVTGDPTDVICTRCGDRWPVAAREGS